MQEKGLNTLVILLLVSIVAPSQAVNALIPATEVRALLELKDHMMTDSQASKKLLGAWNTNNTYYVCASWAGVRCTSTGDHIYGINLAGLELAGSLPPQLSNLTFLVTLNLSANHLSGFIPAELARCRSLKVLDLSENNLTGPIPSSLSSLSSLQHLDLRENSLTGVIPSSIITNCTSLEGLYLNANHFTGQIPMEMGALGNLTGLWLFENNLTGEIPSSLANCTKLLEIALFTNQLIGPVPTAFGSLLNTLYLDDNHLTGPLPSSLSNYKNLQYLGLSANHLNGSIPTEFGALSRLRVLLLWGNNFIGAIPSTLGNCTRLLLLGLEKNQLTGPIPAELGLLPLLQILALWQNRLTGAIPSSLGNCTQINSLLLALNQLSGFIPSEITMLPHVQYLDLSDNHLLGFTSLSFSNFTSLLGLDLHSNKISIHNILPQLGNPQQLQMLNLGGNQFSGEISWESFTNFSSLFTLDLSDNSFSGRITNSLGKLQKLQHLLLQGNLLEGTIPNFEGFPQFTSLSIVNLSFNLLDGPLPQNLLGQLQISLDLSHNNFSGNLPSWMGKLVMVQIMDFSNNKFVGNIPESLGDCANLISLSLSHNNVSGVIPISLSNLTSLETLDLSNNKLTGVLPSFLQHLLRLQFLNVSNNNLNGEIPSVGVFKLLNASSFQGNSGLCGSMIQKNCMEPLEKHHHSKSHLNWKVILFIALASSIAGTLLLVVALRYIYSHCYKSLRINQKFDLLARVEKYTAEELIEATHGYSEENILGEGALGIVYKAVLLDGKVVAVKKFKDVCSREALLQEVDILSKLRHKNLVRVFGCVLNLDVNALVLDFMPNGSLEHYMHQDEHEPKELGWEMLMKIAIGVANALTYLHHEYGVPIIHGDVKPSNILLDSNLEAHLADFGLAKLVKGEAISLSSTFKGSIGYMAPEYVFAARITTKVDVYSFGVVVLEMLTGKRATRLREGTLHEWVKSELNDVELSEVLQASLLHSHSFQERNTSSNVPNEHMALQLLKMGVACTEKNPSNRPTMQKVSSFLIHDRKRREL